MTPTTQNYTPTRQAFIGKKAHAEKKALEAARIAVAAYIEAAEDHADALYAEHGPDSPAGTTTYTLARAFIDANQKFGFWCLRCGTAANAWCNSCRQSQVA